MCLIQDSNIPVAFNGINKSFPQWPVIPTQPLQFFRTELLFFFLSVRKPANWNTKGVTCELDKLKTEQLIKTFGVDGVLMF